MGEEVSKGQQVKDLMRRLEVMGGAVQDLESRLRFSESKNKVLEAEKAQWEAEKVKQQTIIAQALGASNATSNGYLEENQELKRKVVELEEQLRSK